jgi:short-subunit dehydrogenase
MQYALITGAANGIGKGIAAALAKRKYNLLLADIDENKLIRTKDEFTSLYGVSIQTLTIDLTVADVTNLLWNWTLPFHDDLSIIINNAGYGLNGNFESISIDQQINIIDLNIRAQLKIAHAYIPVLREFPKAYLLNVGSTTSYQSVPYLSVYAASKAFVLSFTRSLKYELRDSTISVSCLSPGSTDTHFVERAGMSERTKEIAKRFNMKPGEVGEAAVRGLLRGNAEIIPGFANKLNAWLPKFFPKLLTEQIAGSIYQQVQENKKNKVIRKQRTALN